MADEPITTPQSGTPAQPGQNPVPTTPAPTSEEPFDKERAMATINKLREFEKQSKELSKKVAEYEAAEKKRAEAEMTEAQKMQARLAEQETATNDFKAKFEQAAQEIALLRLRGEVERNAVALGFNNPDDAYLLADFTDVEMDDAGKFKEGAIKTRLETLLKARPYLAKGDQPKPIGTPKPGQRNPAPSGGTKKPTLGIRL